MAGVVGDVDPGSVLFCGVLVVGFLVLSPWTRFVVIFTVGRIMHDNVLGFSFCRFGPHVTAKIEAEALGCRYVRRRKGLRDGVQDIVILKRV